MSKFTLPLFALFLMGSTLSAQAQMADRLFEHPHPAKARVDEAVNLTREMTSQLHLNEGQYLKLLPLNRTKLAALRGLAREYRTDAPTLAAKTAELLAQYEQACSQVLTPSQFSQLRHPAALATGGPGLG